MRHYFENSKPASKHPWKTKQNTKKKKLKQITMMTTKKRQQINLGNKLRQTHYYSFYISKSLKCRFEILRHLFQVGIRMIWIEFVQHIIRLLIWLTHPNGCNLLKLTGIEHFGIDPMFHISCCDLCFVHNCSVLKKMVPFLCSSIMC